MAIGNDLCLILENWGKKGALGSDFEILPKHCHPVQFYKGCNLLMELKNLPQQLGEASNIMMKKLLLSQLCCILRQF